MELTREHPIRRFENGQVSSAADPVISESRIELDVNDGAFQIAMLCLPQDLEALAVGFLLTEGALRRVEDLGSVEVTDDGRILARGTFDADVLANLRLRWTWGTGCGSGGTSRGTEGARIETVGPGPAVTADQLFDLGAAFGKRTALWRRTGAVHACALADSGQLLLFAEDVGRHNAFDKIVGMAALRGIDPAGKIVLTTGRLTAEIVAKALACRVPILASRSAVTDLAVKLARRHAQTLVGFLRGKRLNVYTGFQRVVEAQ
jgi:FdhD protein